MADCRRTYEQYPQQGREVYALTLAAAGRPDEAAEIAAVREDLPRDVRFKIMMTVRGLLGLALNDYDRVVEAYNALRPLDNEVAGGDTGGYAVLLPIAQLLGDLAVRLGQAQTANGHYRKAREIGERAGVPQWTTTAHEALARTVTQFKPQQAW